MAKTWWTCKPIFDLVYFDHNVYKGGVVHEVVVGSRAEAAECMRKVLRRIVMVSSARQAVSGLLTAGGATAVRYVAKKMRKAWNS